MTNQKNQNENTQNKFYYAMNDLKIAKLLRQSNITKNCGVPVFEVFQFLFLLSLKVTTAYDHLTRPERVKAFILDDSVIKRNRSKKVELLARIYDYVEHKFQRGFSVLTLDWTDGYSFIPVIKTESRHQTNQRGS